MDLKLKRLIVAVFVGVGMVGLLLNTAVSLPLYAQADPCQMDALTPLPETCSPDAAIGAADSTGSLDWLKARLTLPEESDSPEAALEAAYQRVVSAKEYEFSLDGEQTLIPRAEVNMIGQTQQSVDIKVVGEVTLPDYSMMSISMEGLGLDATPVAMVLEDGESYLLRDGEKIPMENPVGLAAPNGDYLSYLAAAKNVQLCESESAPFDTAVSCYTYDIDGPAFAEHVRQQLQAQLAQTPGATALGLNASASPLLQQMSGQGKVWLDANGLPLRQKVDMHMPEVDTYYDADVSMYIDYQFEADAVAAALTSVSMLPSSQQVIDAVQTSLPNAIVLVLFLTIAVLLILLRRRRWMYSFIAISITVIMVATPLLQILNAELFSLRRAYAAESAVSLADTFVATDSLDEAVVERPSTTTAPAPTLTVQTAAATYQPESYCGQGSNSDRDGDGLADDAEYCLGTDPNNSDTDRDGITDGAEVAGFTYNDQTWFSDPLKVDSNRDGLDDGSEWIAAHGGIAAAWDLDSDLLPNMWDMDDDGDGVSDRNDLSPASFTNYFFEPAYGTQTISDTFNFNISGQYDGFIYVEMQVQPEDLDHLRYGANPLDWGFDNLGLIQDFNGSTDDIRLIPLLSVKTNIVPSSDLQKQYGVTVMEDNDNDGLREMLMPLMRVGDGGNTEALAMRMAYGPKTLADLEQTGVLWQDASLIWMVQAKIDQENDQNITEKEQPIHLYTERAVRLAGWQVTKSGEFNSAILGTPDMPTDDRQLFQLLFGLSGSYLSYPEVTLAEVDARFSGANTPIAEKWGVTTTVKIDAPLASYGHYDEGVQDLDERVKAFLTDNYSMDNPTVVIIASESRMGMYGQDDMGALTPSVNELGVNLNEVFLIESRALELHMRDGWNVVGKSDFDTAVVKRNLSFFKDAETDLKDQYPNITAEELTALTLAFYMTWQNGRSRIMSVDGITGERTVAFTDQQVYTRYAVAPLNKKDGAENIKTLAGYLVEAGNFAKEGSGLIFSAGPAQMYQFIQGNFNEMMEMGINHISSQFINNISKGLDTLSESVALFDTDELHASFERLLHSDGFGQAKTTFLATVTALDTAYDTTSTIAKALRKGKSVATKMMKTANKLSKVSKVGIALLILDIGMQVTMFILKGDFSPAAIAALLAGILLSVMLFIIALNPVGAIIVAIVGVVDLILLLVGLGDYQISGYVTKFMALGFYSSSALTRLKSDSMTFVDRQTGLVDQGMGYIAGNRYRVTDQFKAVIELARSDWGDDFGFTRLKQEVAHWGGISSKYLIKSWACAEFKVAGWGTLEYYASSCPSPFLGLDPDNPPSKQSIGFQNPMEAEILLDTPGANMPLSIMTKVTARTYNLNGGVVNLFTSGSLMSYDPFTLTLPDDMDDEDKNAWVPQVIYLDVLPPTIEEFWMWSSLVNESILTNNDPDGDGMTTEDEIIARLGSKAFSILEDDLGPLARDLGFTNVNQLLMAWETEIDGSNQTYEELLNASNNCPTNTGWPNLCDSSQTAFWLDSDSDGDGLSDQFEYNNVGALGTDFEKYDTDNDGMSDGFEYQVGTAINAVDTDGDGLTDAEEVYHPTGDGSWAGGYIIQLPKYGAVGPNGRFMMDVRVFSDPLAVDTDGDGISDAAEKENGTSPTGYNRVPRVTLTGQPWAVSPTGQGAVYVGPNDRITLTTRIDVFPPFTVSDTLTLDIPSSVLGANTTPSLNGSRTVPNTGYYQRPRWDFSNNVLQPWEYLYATTSGWSPYVSSSRTATATLTIPYNDGEAVQTAELPIVLDADNPRFSLLTPAHGELLGGGVTHYVMGGSSYDRTTWVEQIDLNLPTLGSQIITDNLNLSPWAYTWELPGDGIYSIDGRSTDFVGNTSATDAVSVMIDNTAPTTDVDLQDGAVYGPPQDSSVITITLNGSASENYSGLTRVQISTDYGPWREVWTQESAAQENTTYTDFGAPFYQRATGAVWTADWTLPNVESVQGYHSLRVRAFDEAGNWPTPIERTIIIDVLPPTDDLVNRAYLNEYPHVPANEPHTFRGIANDVGNVPQPSRPQELVGDLDSINDATIWLGPDSIDENNGGVNVAWIGDFNGDRRGDLLVGLPAAAHGAGKIAIVYGRSGDWPVPDAQEMLADAMTSFKGLPGAGIGLQAVAAGDVNGDGMADILIGDAANNAVYLVLGKTNYYGKNLPLDGPLGVNIRRLQAPEGEQIGHNIAAAGDVNGDGYDDILIGVTGSRDDAYLLLGQPDPVWETNDIDQHAAAIIDGAGLATLGAAGDLDGDFRDEFAVGMNNTLYLFAGSGTFTPRAGRLIYPSSHHVDTLASADNLPLLAALGDVNGDNKDDMIYSDGDSQRLLLGDDNLSDGSWTAQTYSYGSGFVAAPGDVDSDGRSDILIGDGANAYLILGSDIGTAHATISGVASAASVRYPGGADLNSDGSSDLLLVPTAASAQAAATTADSSFDLPPSWVPNLPEQSLETFVGSNTFPTGGASAYVNATGDCHGDTPCYSNIQTAVDNVNTNAIILVQPGVYDPFIIDGDATAYHYLTVRGTDPDAVIIDGGGSSYAIRVNNTLGVNLEKMTVRNATYGVQLNDAGVGGHKDNQLGERTILDHLLIYDTSAHNVYIDRSSTVTVSNSTLARAGNHVGVDMSDSFDVTVDAGWQAEPNTPDAFYDGGGLATYDDVIFYCTGGGGRTCKWKRAEDSSWFIPWAPPTNLEAGSTLAAGSDGNFYAVSAPGWDDMPESPDQIDYLGQPDFLASRFNGNLLAMPQLGQGFLEWDGSSWTNHGAGSMAEQNSRGIAENPTNGDVAIAVNGHGLYIWDGAQFNEIVAFSQWSNEPLFRMSVGAYDSQGNLYTFQSMEDTENPGQFFNTIEKYDGSQWTTVTEYLPASTYVMEADNQNNVYISEGSHIMRYDGNTLWSLGSIGIMDPHTVEALAYDENLDNLFACTDLGDIARYDGGSWTILPPVTTGAGPLTSSSCSDLAYSGQIFASGEWHEETPEGDIEINLARWNNYDERWEPIGANEICVSGDPSWCTVDALAGGSKGLYVLGVEFNDLGDDNYSYLGQKVSHYHFSTSVYSTTLNGWHTVTPPPAIGPGASMAGSDDGTLALIAGNGDDRVYTYDIATNQWDSNDTLEADQTPINVTASAMTFADGYFYAITNGGEFCSSSNGDYWSCSSEGDIDEGTMGTIDGGASLTYDPKFETFYAFVGGNGTNMLRYNTGTNTWELLPAGRFTPSPIKPGAGLVFVPGDEGNSLYAVEGNYSGTNTGFWRYPIPEPNKIGFENSAIVVPPGSPSADWLSLSDPLPEDVNFRVGSGSLWFNSTGRPNNGGSLPRSSADPFLDASRDLYRMGENGASYTIGYHSYTAPVTATTATGIQAMINTGANQVIVQPGIYEEDVYLVNGVELIGTNPDWTVIKPLSGSAAEALVRAMGSNGASFSRFTLDGESSGLDGFAATGNAANLTVQRARIYDMDTAITVDGPNSDVEVAHVTAVNNTNGLVATNCASIDVRNSIFAYDTGMGLSHEACADVTLHTYNLYWANGSDFGGAADAGAAELFLDPSFVDPMDHDYRTLNFSPVIDAGNPTDPSPPGAGSRADIGYIEQGRVNFYVDDSYCAICTNDGLTWQIDAFDNIQDALNAAENALSNLNPSLADVPQLVVGVAPGAYNEQVTIPSHVLLFGSGAEETIINAGGSGTAVSFHSVTDAGIRNLAVRNADTAVSVTGASNSIDLRRNLLTNNTTGLAIDGRATVSVEYNTFANNNTALHASDPGSWMIVMHNIIAQSNIGAQRVNGGQIFSNYNLYFNTVDVDGVSVGENDITGQNPLFAGGGTPYRLSETSPAVDAAALTAPVPNGGGAVADLGYSELLAAPITLLLGREDLSTVMGNSGVATVEYGVAPVLDNTSAVTATLPGEWNPIALDTPGDTLSYWALDHTPQDEGLYRFYSRATDMVGNQEDNELDWYDGSFVVDSTPPTVEWLTPPNGAALTAPLELRARVSDYAAGEFSVDENDVYFEVGGQRYAATWAAEPWDEAAGESRVFRAWISPTLSTFNDVIAGAEDKAGNTATTEATSFTVTAVSPEDTVPPTVTVSLPPPNSWVTHTVQFAGTATDAGSGIAAVEVSVDGGATWQPATVSGNDWSVAWEGPTDQPFISYPAQVRATDRAGNVVASSLQFTIDEIAPSGLLPVTFSDDEGTHFDAAAAISMTWSTPLDASGVVTTLLAVDQVSTTVPVDVVTGNTAQVTLDSSGDWYIHLMAADAAGNAVLHSFGPWHVGITDGDFAARAQSIIIDGYVDVDNNEWRLDSEYLDDDERTYGSEVTYSPGEQQAFLTTWDANHTYLAWRGSHWALDGELWIYVNSGGGGSSEMMQPLAAAPDATLPFDADYAIRITDPLSGTLYEYSGGWQESALDWAFANGGSGDTEIRLPLLGTSNLEALAFGLGDDHNVWAIFPTTNPLNPGNPAPQMLGANGTTGVQNDPPATGWESYHWDDVTAVTNVTDNQPSAVGLTLDLDSLQASQAAWGPNSTLQYVVEIMNMETDWVSNQPIAFTASPAAALIHESIAGATCSATNPWECTLDPLAPGLNTITLTTRLAADLDGFETVMMQAALTGADLTPEMITADAIMHRLDGAPPEVSVDAYPFVGLGSTIFNGTASDGDGAGVDTVEVRPEFGSWQRVEGAQFWTADLTVFPSLQHGDSWQFEVRATDQHGQASEPQVVSFTVDLQGPAITFEPATAMSGGLNEIIGAIHDVPTGSEAVSVQVQVDDGAWRDAILFALNEDTGEQPFLWTWQLPTEDGVTHTLRVQAADTVGNSTMDTTEVWVDTVTPALTVTNVLTEVAVQHYYPGAQSGDPVLIGTVTDGTEVAAVDVWVEKPDGSSYLDTAVLNNGAWAYTPALTDLGVYKLQVRARDSLSNQSQTSYYLLNVKAAPVSGPNNFLTPEDTPITIEPLLDDVDIDSEDIFIDDVADPLHGAAAISGTSEIVYTPDANFFGVEPFTYVASDGQFTDTATVTVTVLPVNDPPQISGADTITATMAEDSGTLTFNFSGVNVDSDTWEWTTDPGMGTAVISSTSGVGNLNAEVAYTPELDFGGIDSFRVQVSDGEYSDEVTVEVTVTAVDDAPRAADDYVVLVPDDIGQPITLTVLANDEEVDGQTLLLHSVGAPDAGGAAAINGAQVIYTPTLALGGSETFTYTISDGVLTDTAVIHTHVVAGDASGRGGETITLTGAGANDSVDLTITIPANLGSGDEQVTLVLAESETPADAPDAFKFAGIAFTLEAYVDGVRTTPYALNVPIALEINYSEDDVADIGKGDDELMLYTWDGGEWVTDGIVLVSHDRSANRIVFSISHLTKFALFGKDAFNVYLPLVMNP